MNATVTILGAGSLYAPAVVRALGGRVRPRGLDVRLHDCDHAALARTASAFPSSDANAASNCVTVSPDLARAVEGADIIVHLYRSGGSIGRLHDELFALRHGLTAQETNGIVAASQALRNLAALETIAPVISRSAPAALNVICSNPVGIVTAAAARLGLTTVGMCELPSRIQKAFVEHAIVEQDELLRIAGLNHLWFVGGTSTRSGEELISTARGKFSRMYEDFMLPGTPPTVTSELAEAASRANVVPSPYWQYYLTTRPHARGPVRACRVRSINRLAANALAQRDFAAYEAVLAQRGGHGLDEALALFCGAYTNHTSPSSFGLCIAPPAGASGAARETMCLVSAARIEAVPDGVAPPSMLKPTLEAVASFESKLVDAWLVEDPQGLVAAVRHHPLVGHTPAADAWLKLYGRAAKRASSSRPRAGVTAQRHRLVAQPGAPSADGRCRRTSRPHVPQRG